MLLLADVFNNVWNICLEIYGFDPVHFLSAPRLPWQAALKKTKIKLDLITDTDMLLMVAKGIRGGIWHAVNQYTKANDKYMENKDKKLKNYHILSTRR